MGIDEAITTEDSIKIINNMIEDFEEKYQDNRTINVEIAALKRIVKAYNDLKQLEEAHRIENGKFRERIKQLEDIDKHIPRIDEEIFMYLELKTRLMNSLKAELDYITKFETDKMTKFDKMLQLKNMMLLLEQYEEIEPAIQKAINDIAQKKRFDSENAKDVIAKIMGADIVHLK